MLRLLWKEWIETRWLLLALLVAPPFTIIALKDRYFETREGPGYFGSGGDSTPGLTLVVAALWGATLASEELRRGQFSLFRLPISRAMSFVPKFLSGVIALPVAAAWTALAFNMLAPARLHEHPIRELLLPGAVGLFGIWLLAYCLAFCASLMSSMGVGVLVGVIGTALLNSQMANRYLLWWPVGFRYMATVGASSAEQYVTHMEGLFIYQLICSMAIALGAFAVWRAGIISSMRRKLALGAGVPALALVGAQLALGLVGVVEPIAVMPSVRALPSPDRNKVALVRLPVVRSIGQARMRLVITEVNARRNSEGSVGRELLQWPFIDLLAWSPDSRSLYVEMATQREGPAQIIRITQDGQQTFVAPLPPRDRRGRSQRGQPGEVTSDGRYLVFARKTLGSYWFDIWSVDLRADAEAEPHRARVLAANVDDVSPRLDLADSNSVVYPFAYPGMRIVFREVGLDGSGLKREWWTR